MKRFVRRGARAAWLAVRVAPFWLKHPLYRWTPGGFGYSVRIPLTGWTPGLYVLSIDGRSRVGNSRPVSRVIQFRVK